jgi:hypothetical protein
MSERSIQLLSNLNQQQAEELVRLRARLSSSGGDGTFNNMDLLTYRMDLFEKRSDAADARMARVEDKLTAIQIALASLATKDTIRNWGLAVAAIVIATGVSVGALMLQSSSNQMAAFQSGLSAIQAVTAAAQVTPPHSPPKP